MGQNIVQRIESEGGFCINFEINADVRDFFTDIPKKINETQLIISRAGASTIAEISIIGRPSILIPLTHELS